MRIGLFGFDFVSSNKGCEALTYTFLAMINQMVKQEKITVYNFTYNNSLGQVPGIFPNIKFEHVKINLKNPMFWLKSHRIMKECRAFFDATFGDGFSDIYGRKWNVKTDLIKQMVLWSKTPLVLAPQTYGPYKNEILKKWAMRIVKKSSLVYARDELSANIVKEFSDCDVKVASDMAFKLPYDKALYPMENNKIKVGLNISSLLWDSAWSEQNHFGLEVNYHKFHEGIIESIMNNPQYELHVIPHVIDMMHPDARENDYRVCQQIKEKYGKCVHLAPAFKTPIEAKSYISNMDVFIGSRMHATIAAISSGVATIPFSYSRKFEGLYGNLGYPYVVSARHISTDEAMEQTLQWIRNYKQLQGEGKQAALTAIDKLQGLEHDIMLLLKD